ncbi:hypothetical protein N7530_010439 [Penicillium desertorum]|uniref:Uncharacterized protein n=1 Tax=Penicillium desertorum TaxID=1303715 RepID=A0A9X0BHN4_9EURO|nr:hypothetical protein N7530_010439 [Penicillium desertorum]
MDQMLEIIDRAAHRPLETEPLNVKHIGKGLAGPNLESAENPRRKSPHIGLAHRPSLDDNDDDGSDNLTLILDHGQVQSTWLIYSHKS